MTFKDIVTQVKIENVWEKFIEFYPDHFHLFDEYEKVFNELLEIETTEEKMRLCFNKEYENCNLCIPVLERGKEACKECKKGKGKSYISVCGYLEEEPNVTYAIELSPWKEWLSMEIREKDIYDYSKEELVAHAMWEMTFFGLDQETIDKESKRLQKSIEQVEEDIASGKAESYKTAEEVFQELKEKLNFDIENTE